MLREGKIVEGLADEPVVLVKVENLGDYVLIKGKTLRSGTYLERYITKQEFGELRINKSTIIAFGAKASDVFLALETARYRHVMTVS
ncbi:hypothetical protein [Thermocrinis sp.]